MFIKELDYTIDLSKIIYINRSGAILSLKTNKPYIMVVFNNNMEIRLYYDNEEILNERYNYISNLLVDMVKQ